MDVYKFKVALMYDKRTYTEIELLENHTLEQLHHIIFKAFDRYEEHLYSFFLTRKATKSKRTIFDSQEFTSPIALEDDLVFWKKEKNDASKTQIRDLDLVIKDKIYYLFDFGD